MVKLPLTTSVKCHVLGRVTILDNEKDGGQEIGLVNGAQGVYISSIVEPDFDAKNLFKTREEAARDPPPLPTLLVKLDNYRGKGYVVKDENGADVELEGVVPIRPTSVNLNVTMDGNKRSFTRIMYSLAHATSFTTHKSQGMSAEEIAIDPHGIFAGGMAYVDCSRGKHYDKIYILHKKLTLRDSRSTWTN
jgi:hypothetical protein